MSNTTRRRCSSRTVRVRDLVALIGVTGATVGVVGCGSSGSTAPQTGSLTVTITAPSGVTPSVTVSGPGGYTKALSATTTLTGLAVGTYAVTAAPMATYAPRPGSGGMWIANAGAMAVVQYTAGQLGSTTSAPPVAAVGTGGAANYGVAFDANGNLWLTLSANAVVEYTAGQLRASGTPTPAVALSATAGSLSGPFLLAFDANGNLWVANASGNSVVEFTVSQLASSGSPAPAVTLSASSGSLISPNGLAFDASGNLWAANFNGSSVVEFSVSQLASSGSPTPAVTISSSSGSLSGPDGLAFDASGNLWVANGDDSSVVEFTSSQLAASGSPTPAVTLSATAGSLSGPIGLAFDASGNLWVANFNRSTVVEFTASQLVVSGSPTPNVIVSGSALSGPVGFAFDPHATGLPLKP
jgi:sugar lactone lactonase YvrE